MKKGKMGLLDSSTPGNKSLNIVERRPPPLNCFLYNLLLCRHFPFRLALMPRDDNPKYIYILLPTLPYFYNFCALNHKI
jgi:hypothetical protein